MPSKLIVSLILVAISSLFTSASIAQRSEQPPTAQEQRQPSGQRPMGPEGTGMGMGPGHDEPGDDEDDGTNVRAVPKCRTAWRTTAASFETAGSAGRLACPDHA
jgi:hypothetical protein